MRLLITGVPGSGKTTLASALTGLSRYAWTVLHWDSYKHLRWDDQPQAVLRDARSVTTPHTAIEGCGASRLLHSGSRNNREPWLPYRVLECFRRELEAPSHKGHATRIEREMAPWRSSEIYVGIPDARVAVATLGEIVELLGIGEEV